MAGHSIHTTEIVKDQRVVALRRRRLRVEVLRGPDKGLRRELDLDRIVLGTHPSCDLVLSEATVSRQHCEIVLVRDGYAVRDLGSTNGTFLDAVRVRDVVVDGKIRLQVGNALVSVTPLDQTVELALEAATDFGPLVGRSVHMRRIFATLRRLAAADATVLITGESGTGKELAARAIHDQSRRAPGPFLVVDCAALPATLIESQLYGHERGAFTGADRARMGAFEAAHGGTLFLDEVGELPLELQARLLGVIERRTVQPLGSTRTRAVDVRLLAATNRDLRREVNRGSFREDLYFRLAVVVIEMPPLRERPEDIPLYVDKFLAEFAGEGPPPTLDADTIARLCRAPWLGNVRELRNAIERACALGGEIAVAAAAPPTVSTAVDSTIPFKMGKGLLIEQYERAYVEDLMRRHEGNITRAARAAEIDRVYLLRLLDKYGLRPTRR